MTTHKEDMARRIFTEWRNFIHWMFTKGQLERDGTFTIAEPTVRALTDIADVFFADVEEDPKQNFYRIAQMLLTLGAPTEGPLVERLADLAHDMWTHWVEHLISKGSINSDGHLTIWCESLQRWQRQMATKYHNLSDAEKRSDREWAQRMLKIMEEHMAEAGRLDMSARNEAVTARQEKQASIPRRLREEVGKVRDSALRLVDLADMPNVEFSEAQLTGRGIRDLHILLEVIFFWNNIAKDAIDVLEGQLNED